MVESNNAEKLNIDVCINNSTVSTGDNHKDKQLYPLLSDCIKRAKKIDIIVSFLMESGVRYLLKDLKAAVDRGVPIRILTGNYLGITQPSALFLIKRELGDRVQMRFYSEKERSFHPKSYIMHYDSYSDIFLGSSNISRSALSSGIEWNYRLSSNKDPESYLEFYQTFIDLYENHSVIIDDAELKEYSRNWHKPSAVRDLERYDELDSNVVMLYEPRGAQIEALCALENTRNEGANKALIVAATGIGKTFLAAFDSKKYERVLFVAHREEILKQAAESFKKVRISEDYGFFNGEQKCTGKSVVFASVATLGCSEYLNDKYFSKDYFQYIVIDEFHHAVNNQYKKIIEYFEPEFLLGLTATPDRMDSRSIYELCDYNVPYEIGLKEGINKGMLVPFHYYGIYDDTDYSGIHVVRGRYDEKELNETYIGNVHRHDLIEKYYRKYGSKRALGFCCSRVHAKEMAAEFSKRGIPSVAVYSNAEGEFSEDRVQAIQRLKKGDIKVIFSVDMFNEGVDITEVDMVMFLRPTESPIVFMQQLGRGLRKSRDKEYLNVLDFIGNYKKAGRVRYLLTGRNKTGKAFQYAEHDDYPDGCLIDFDMRLVDLFKEMDRKQMKVKDIIREDFFRVKEVLGYRPNRMELFTSMDDDVYQLAMAHAKDNPFKNYLEFLYNNDELTQEELSIFNNCGGEFLHLIETTEMSRVYKMPVLMAFYNNGAIRLQVTESELLIAWKKFFDTNGNWKDFKLTNRSSYLEISDKEHIKKIMQMPVHFLHASGSEFFIKKDGYALALHPKLSDVITNKAFVMHMKDIIDYRTMNYYQTRYNSVRGVG